jgi:hypothetical protein
VRLRLLERACKPMLPGVVHQNIEVAKTLDHFGNGALHGVLIPIIGTYEQACAAVARDIRQGFLT